MALVPPRVARPSFLPCLLFKCQRASAYPAFLPLVPLILWGTHLLSLSLSLRSRYQLPGAVSRPAAHGNARRGGRGRLRQGPHGSPPPRGPRAELHPPRDGLRSLHRREPGALSLGRARQPLRVRPSDVGHLLRSPAPSFILKAPLLRLSGSRLLPAFEISSLKYPSRGFWLRGGEKPHWTA